MEKQEKCTMSTRNGNDLDKNIYQTACYKVLVPYLYS